MEKYPNQKLEKEWIHNGISEEVCEWAESFGQYLCAYGEEKPQKKALTTGQLRKFFGEIKRINSDVTKNQAAIVMLKPLLAYAVGRDKDNKGNNKTRIEEFARELTTAIDGVLESQVLKIDYSNFVRIVEAIVAYHKFYGGKENNN